MAERLRGMPKIAWNNIAQSSTLTATSQQNEFPVTNAIQSQPSVAWRSSGITSIYEKITGTFSSPQDISCYGLFNITSTPYSNAIVSLYSSIDATGTPLYSHGYGGTTAIIDTLRKTGDASLLNTVPVVPGKVYTLTIGVDDGVLTTVFFQSATTPVALATILGTILAQPPLGTQTDIATFISGSSLRLEAVPKIITRGSNIYIKEPLNPDGTVADTSILRILRDSGLYEYVYLYHKRRPPYGYGEFHYGELPYGTGDGYGRNWARDSQVNFFNTIKNVRSYTVEFTQPIDSPDTPVDFFKCGLIYLGTHWSPAYGIPLSGYSSGYQSLGASQRSVSGYLATEKAVSYKKLTLPISYISDIEAAMIMQAISINLCQEDIMVSVFDDDPSVDELLGTTVGRLTSIPSLDKDSGTRRYKTTLVIEETR